MAPKMAILGYMIDLVDQHRGDLAELCRRFRVERLSIFGSAAAGRVISEASDLDFLVNFAGYGPTGEYADRYLDFADGLEKLFGRRVDLVTEQSMRNPYFRRAVEATRRVVYERSNQSAAV